MENNNRVIELAVGSVSNRGIVIPVEDLNKYIKPETELYRSLFLLDDSAIEHFRDKGTIRSYRGYYALDKLTFDIDKKKDTGDIRVPPDSAQVCICTDGNIERPRNPCSGNIKRGNIRR